MKDLVKEANDFCKEFHRLYENEENTGEKIILLQVLTERMNAWSIEQQLRIIQQRSKGTS